MHVVFRTRKAQTNKPITVDELRLSDRNCILVEVYVVQFILFYPQVFRRRNIFVYQCLSKTTTLITCVRSFSQIKYPCNYKAGSSWGLCPLDYYWDSALDLMATRAVPRPLASLEIRPQLRPCMLTTILHVNNNHTCQQQSYMSTLILHVNKNHKCQQQSYMSTTILHINGFDLCTSRNQLYKH